jgi:hypothetical protein
MTAAISLSCFCGSVQRGSSEDVCSVIQLLTNYVTRYDITFLQKEMSCNYGSTIQLPSCFALEFTENTDWGIV